MRRSTVVLAVAAAMTVGGIALTPQINAQQMTASAQPSDTAQQTADVAAVRTLIGDSANSALTANSFGQVIDDFAMPPVNPGNNPAQPNGQGTQAPAAGNGQPQSAAPGAAAGASAVTRDQTNKLDEQIRLFRQAYKSKYGADFVVKDPQTLFGDITSANLNAAQATLAAAEIKGQPGTANNQQNSGATNAPATPTPPVNNNTNDKSNMSSPEWTTLSVPEYQGAPAVTIHLIRVGNAFRYASIHRVNEQALVTNLTDCLTKVNNNAAHWPDDPNTTTRLVSQHVLGAIQKTQEDEMNTGQQPANQPKDGGSDSMK